MTAFVRSISFGNYVIVQLLQFTRHSLVILFSSANLLSVHCMKVYSGFFIIILPKKGVSILQFAVGHMKRTSCNMLSWHHLVTTIVLITLQVNAIRARANRYQIFVCVSARRALYYIMWNSKVIKGSFCFKSLPIY